MEYFVLVELPTNVAQCVMESAYWGVDVLIKTASQLKALYDSESDNGNYSWIWGNALAYKEIYLIAINYQDNDQK